MKKQIRCLLALWQTTFPFISLEKIGLTNQKSGLIFDPKNEAKIACRFWLKTKPKFCIEKRVKICSEFQRKILLKFSYEFSEK